MRFVLILLAVLASALPVLAQGTPAAQILSENRALIERSSRQTIGPVIEALAASGDASAAAILDAWATGGWAFAKATAPSS